MKKNELLRFDRLQNKKQKCQNPSNQHMKQPIKPAYETWKYLSQDNNFQEFMKEFLMYLQDNLHLINVHSDRIPRSLLR